MRTINHPIEPEELMAYLDGELSAGRATAAAAHLEHCRDCQTLAADLRGVGQRLMSWQIEEPSARLSRNADALLDERQPTVARARRIPMWAWGLAVAGLAALVIATPRISHRPIMADRLGSPSNFVLDGQLVPDKQQHRPAGQQGGQQAQQGGRAQDSNGFFRPMQTPPPAPTPVDVLSSVNGPLIVRTAHLTLATPQFDTARSALEAILKQHHGYFAELNVSAPENTGRTLQTTLRVPSADLETSIAELKKLGRVEDESQGGEEVTAQYVDLEARLGNSRNTEQRLTDLLRQRTGKLSDVLSVEVEIARVRGEIERMEADRKNLSNRVAFAALTVTITEGYKASTAGRFRNAAVEGYRMMADSCINLALLLISYAPIVLLWGVFLLIAARLLWKRARA